MRKLSRSNRNLSRYLFQHLPDFMTLTETKCTKINKIPKVGGYFKFCTKANHTGGVPSGGLCILVKNNLRFVASKVFSCSRNSILWIKIELADRKPLFVGVIYCRTEKFSDEVSEFFNVLAKNVSEFSKEGNICLMGDFNCRIRDFLGDKCQNKNADRLHTFLKFSGLKILNKHFSYGVPTYVYHNNG